MAAMGSNGGGHGNSGIITTRAVMVGTLTLPDGGGGRGGTNGVVGVGSGDNDSGGRE